MAHPKSLQLFCTRDDILAVLTAVEAGNKLQYIQSGLFEKEGMDIFSCFAEIEDFGTSTYGEPSKDPSYLVFRSDSKPTTRSVPQKAGGVMYAIDQLANPDSVALRPGGMYERRCVIAGQLGTASESAESVALYNVLAKRIRSEFGKIRSYWVGPEATVLFKKGFRLTTAANAPASLDLRDV